jgi:hypothetical protein
MAVRNRVAVIAFGAGILSTIGIAAIWSVANARFVPAYGDTSDYLMLARSLRVDEYRTLGYPLLLRATESIAAILGTPMVSLLYILQTVATYLASAYLLSTLADVVFPRFATRVGKLRNALVFLGAAYVTALPLVNHFDFALLTDSLALSLLMIATTAVIRITVLSDTRSRTIVTAVLATAADSFVRSEKAYVIAVTVGITIGAVLLARRGRFRISGAHRVVMALAVVLLATIGTTVVNRSTQVANYGRPHVTVASMLFHRAVWPRLQVVRTKLPANLKSVITTQDAVAVDTQPNAVDPVIVKLRTYAHGSDAALWQVTGIALDCCWPEIAAATAFDLAKYSVTPVTWAGDLALNAQTPTAWTYSRMAMAHPTLTRVYCWWAIAVMLGIQIPLLLIRPRRWRSLNADALAAGAILLLPVVANALLYSVTAALDAHVRYGMPSYGITQLLLLTADAYVVAGLLPQVQRLPGWKHESVGLENAVS